MKYKLTELRRVFGEEGIRAGIVLEKFELPERYPTGPWGRRDPVCHMTSIELVAA